MTAPPLRSLKTFSIAARHGSFKAAADELCVTASAVSHQIKALEDQLGLLLFHRGARSLTLTPAGHYYLEHIDAAFLRLESATEQLRVRFTRQAVRLQVPPFFASELLLPRLAGFSARHPDIDIQIVTHAPAMHAHLPDCDVSVIVSGGPWAELQATALFEQTYIPACAPSLLAGARPCESQLSSLPLIAHNRRPDLWDRWAATAGMKLLRPKQLIHFDTMSAVVHAAEQGVGIALVSAPVAAAKFRSGTLKRLFEHELHTGESYFLVTRPADAEINAVTHLMRWMLEQFMEPARDERKLA
jgi:LysR family transcriptional regulator, glycine cleavage system transcriptional activator